MDINTKTGAVSFSIDLGDLERSLKAREKVKADGLAKAEANARNGRDQDPNFNPRNLLNDLEEKGRLLDIIA